MPQYQQQKKGHSRIKVLSKDETRAYLLLMRHTGGKLQVLPNNIYVVEEGVIQILKDNGIEFETMDQK